MDQPLAELKTLRVKVTKRAATDTGPTHFHVSFDNCSMVRVEYNYAASDPFVDAIQEAIGDHFFVLVEPHDIAFVHQGGASSNYDVTIQAAQIRERTHA